MSERPGEIAERVIAMMDGADPVLRIVYLRDQERAAFHAVRGWIELAEQARDLFPQIHPADENRAWRAIGDRRDAAMEKHAAFKKALAECYDPNDTEFTNPGEFEDFGLVRRLGYRAADGTERQRFWPTYPEDDTITSIDLQIDRLHELRQRLLSDSAATGRGGRA